MSQLIMEFPLDGRNIVLSDGALTVHLGNGVTLKTDAPEWIKWIHSAKLQLIMEVEGSPTDAKPGSASIE